MQCVEKVLTDRKMFQSNLSPKQQRFIFGALMTYVFAYFLRNNYAVALPALLEKTGISRELGGLPITASFISYGIGQIVFGLCGDHLPPGKMIACGWTITILSNILLPFCCLCSTL